MVPISAHYLGANPTPSSLVRLPSESKSGLALSDPTPPTHSPTSPATTASTSATPRPHPNSNGAQGPHPIGLASPVSIPSPPRISRPKAEPQDGDTRATELELETELAPAPEPEAEIRPSLGMLTINKPDDEDFSAASPSVFAVSAESSEARVLSFEPTSAESPESNTSPSPTITHLERPSTPLQASLEYMTTPPTPRDESSEPVTAKPKPVRTQTGSEAGEIGDTIMGSLSPLAMGNEQLRDVEENT